MKILSIGNSFSQDATRYLNAMAKSCNIELKTVNLYIGGCSLKSHYYNILEDEKKYLFEYNGEGTGIYVTVKEALMSDDWDYITVQQVSCQANDYVTYQPYLDTLIEYVKKYCPHSKILVHQTWAYENASKRLNDLMGYNSDTDMFNDVKKAYDKAYKAIKAEGIIPSGEVMIGALKSGVKKMHRDTFHASLGLGRYALALTWLAYLTDINPVEVEFRELDEEVSQEEVKIIKEVVAKVLNK